MRDTFSRLSVTKPSNDDSSYYFPCFIFFGLDPFTDSWHNRPHIVSDTVSYRRETLCPWYRFIFDFFEKKRYIEEKAFYFLRAIIF